LGGVQSFDLNCILYIVLVIGNFYPTIYHVIAKHQKRNIKEMLHIMKLDFYLISEKIDTYGELVN